MPIPPKTSPDEPHESPDVANSSETDGDDDGAPAGAARLGDEPKPPAVEREDRAEDTDRGSESGKVHGHEPPASEAGA